MQAIIKGLEKVKQELSASANDGPVSEVFHKVSMRRTSFKILEKVCTCLKINMQLPGKVLLLSYYEGLLNILTWLTEEIVVLYLLYVCVYVPSRSAEDILLLYCTVNDYHQAGCF